MNTSKRQIRDWQPSTGVMVAWSVLSVVLSFVGTALFASVYLSTHGGGSGTRIGLVAPIVSLLILVALLGAHEGIHGLTMKRYGARPRYGIGLYKKMMPYLYCTSSGYGFTRTQFAVVSAAPLVIISLVGALCVAVIPLGGWLALPLGVHFGGCIGDIWFLGIIARLPQGTLLEDLATGVRIVPPSPYSEGGNEHPIADV